MRELGGREGALEGLWNALDDAIIQVQASIGVPRPQDSRTMALRHVLGLLLAARDELDEADRVPATDRRPFLSAESQGAGRSVKNP